MKTKNYRIEKVVDVNSNSEYFQLVRDNDSAILCAYADVRKCVEEFENTRMYSDDVCGVRRVLEKEIIVKTIGTLKLTDLMR